MDIFLARLKPSLALAVAITNRPLQPGEAIDVHSGDREQNALQKAAIVSLFHTLNWDVERAIVDFVGTPDLLSVTVLTPNTSLFAVLVHVNTCGRITCLSSTIPVPALKDMGDGPKLSELARPFPASDVALCKNYLQEAPHHCAACFSPGLYKVCSGCRKVHYCSVACQKKQRSHHKSVCQ